MAQSVTSRLTETFGPYLQRLSDWAIVKPEADLGPTTSDGKIADAPGLSLSARFAFAASIVLCNGMALLGGWVVTEIEKGLLQASAAEESAYVQSILEPVVTSLAAGNATPEQTTAIDDQISRSALLGKRLASVAVWRTDGLVIYSTDKDLVGRSFPMTPEIEGAISGELKTNFWEKRLLGVYRKRPNDIPVRIIYAPLRDKNSGKVIAVTEIADNAELPKAQLDAIRKRTWIVVGVSTALMILLLAGIVHRGSKTIDEQRIELKRRFDEQTRLAQTNQRLAERLQSSNRHGIELGEQLLRGIGMELQNGPAQLLAFVLLRMDELKAKEEPGGSPSAASSGSVAELIERATADALREIRTIEAGLITPELRNLTPSQVLEKVIRTHEYATGTQVTQNISSLPQHLPLPVTICIFRFAQESLRNAYRYADGRELKVEGFGDGTSVTIVTSSSAPCISMEEPDSMAQDLGLRGVQQRVESIGGTFEILSPAGKGTQLRIRLPYSMAEFGDDDSHSKAGAVPSTTHLAG